MGNIQRGTNIRVVILNGLGSVGKTSTAHALQSMLSIPYLLVRGDMFVEMLPERMFDHPDGIKVNVSPDKSGSIVDVQMGEYVTSLLRGMRRSVAVLADEGNNLIVDDLMLEEHEQLLYHTALRKHETSFVELVAPLELVVARERERGDRLFGLASWQSQRMFSGFQYDLQVDTSQNSPHECAVQIAEALRLF